MLCMQTNMQVKYRLMNNDGSVRAFPLRSRHMFFVGSVFFMLRFSVNLNTHLRRDSVSLAVSRLLPRTDRVPDQS